MTTPNTARRSLVLAIAGLAMALGVSLVVPRVAHAGPNVSDLIRVLTTDSSYKVRLQAALVLGRLGDRNAVPALMKALTDSNNMVRAVSAQALGKLGAPEALDPLQAAMKGESNSFARAQMQSALAVLGQGRNGGPSAGGKASMYLSLGPFTGGARGAGGEEIGVLRTALQQNLNRLGGVTFQMSAQEEASFKRSGGLGFLIDGNVTRLDAGLVGGVTEVNCDVKVQVFKWPSRSLISWTSAGAAVQSGSRDRDKEMARVDCLKAAAGQLGDDLTRFFKSQGG